MTPTAPTAPDLTHRGRRYYRTGKVGTSLASGLAAAEYDCRGARVWLDTAGAVRPE